jgi:carboxyl-terminal processing protease
MKRARRKTPGARVLFGAAGLLAIVTVIGFAPSQDGDYFFKINKSIDVFGRVYKEITANYVDEVDPERFMHSGIEGMLEALDPYTVFINKEEGDEVDLLTSGKYGGIGVTIGQRDGIIQVISVMDGYSAQRQGIVPGDKIISVDGVTVGMKKPDEVRNLTRGEPGTEVRVVIDREGEHAPLQFVLIREEIQVKNVTFTDFLDNGLAYIRLERFSRKAGDEVRQAIKELKLRGEVKGLVLDLRGNPGGLLDAAVDVVSKFVARGSLVVSTKGRRTEADKQYISTEEPLLPITPLIVLTDRSSASASEIVAGALQDLDRAVVVGTRTFGKGLVQTILPLNYGAQLKVTTARYYTPSGRSIQEIDYRRRDKSGVVVVTTSDSLKKRFETAHGRPVYEHGGIVPDSTVNEDDVGPMVKELFRKSLFFRFATRYVAERKGASSIPITDQVLDEFKKFLAELKFDYQEESQGKIKELKQVAERSHFGLEVVEDLDRLAVALEKEKARGFDRYRDHIERELDIEIMARLNGEHGRIGASLKGDRQLETAVGILKDAKLYTRMTGS